MNCRSCRKALHHTVIDMGHAPPSNAYLSEDDLRLPERYYPLRIKLCSKCWLVQTEDYADPDELFTSDYAYFSSTSTTWLKHASEYVDMIIEKLRLDSSSFVLEIASNDGYLLKNFVSQDIPCIGIEPSDGTARHAEASGVETRKVFFSEKVAHDLVKEGLQADLVIGNNVYAHVPDINDFTRGLKAILSFGGTVTLEFPHLMKLINQIQFDTIYHEHFSYLSLDIVIRLFTSAGLKVWDVQEIPTHGGSLRIYGCHIDDTRAIKDSINKILEEERQSGLRNLSVYLEFQNRANSLKNKFLEFLLEQKRHGKKVAAYGAAAKGNTLLNFCGIKPDLVPFICDASESKQNRYMPGSHIPILPPEALLETPLDFIVILPWNLSVEVKEQLSQYLDYSTRYVTLIPELEIS